MSKITAGYKTGSGNIMEMTVHTGLLNRYDVPLIDADGDYNTMAQACQHGVGCKGKNGGCPPYAPMFGNIKPSLPDFCVITVEYDMAWSIKYGGWRKEGVTTPALYISAYANALTGNYIRRIVKGVEEYGFYALGASNCPGCSPKKCTVLQGQKCIKPDKRRYSMEATGVNCCDLHWTLFDTSMPWLYGNTSEYIHARMYRYAGFFCEAHSPIYYEGIVRDAVLADWSYCDRPGVGIKHKLERYTDIHPEGSYDEGSEFEVYRIPFEVV